MIKPVTEEEPQRHTEEKECSLRFGIFGRAADAQRDEHGQRRTQHDGSGRRAECTWRGAADGGAGIVAPRVAIVKHAVGLRIRLRPAVLQAASATGRPSLRWRGVDVHGVPGR